MQVNQLLPGFTTGDAISNYTLELQGILRSRGYESSIFSISQNVSMDGRAYCRDYRDYNSGREDVMIFHFSVSSELTEYFRSLPIRKILVYHNVTPAEYFAGINKEKQEALRKGREELSSLAESVDLALGVSEYNRQELGGLGFKKTGVLDLILNEGILAGEPNNELVKKYNDNFTNFLTVGRLTPNKKLEDVIRAFYYYKKCINPNSRLFLVGSIVGMSSYVEYLRGLTAVLSLPDVVFTRHVDSADLRTYYKLADLFITMSEHEGFCIPLLESMYFGIPIIAYSSSAIPEILDGSGVLVKEKNYPEIAELAHLILNDDGLRSKIIKEEKSRLLDFDREKTAERLMDYLEKI